MSPRLDAKPLNRNDRSVRIRDRLVCALKADLVGPMDPHEVIDTRPSRW